MKAHKAFGLILLAISFAGFITACGNSSKSGSSNNTVATAGVCTTCNTIPNAAKFYEGTTQYSGLFSFQMTLAIFADQAVINQLSAYNPYAAAMNPITSYQGPIAINGVINIPQAATVGYCAIPAGNYNIVNAEVGQMVRGSFQVNSFVINNGGVNLQMRLAGAGVRDRDGDGYPETIYGTLQFVSGPSAYYGGYGNAGGYINCNDYYGITFGGY